MTRIQQMELVGNRLKEEAAKATAPMARASALKAAGELDMQVAPLMSMIAMRRTLLTASSAGRIAPEQVVRMVVPEGQQPMAYKELQEAKNTVAAKDNILAAFDKLAQIQTVGNRMLSPLQSKSQLKAIMDPITASLSKGTAGRFTEADAGFLERLWPNVTDDQETLSIKRQQLNKLISEKMHFPVLDAYGINVNQMGARNTQGAKRFQLQPPVR